MNFDFGALWELTFLFSLLLLVIRAKVLSQEVFPENFTRVFNLRILKTFKGGVRLNQTEGIRPYGSRQRSLFAKAYTASYDSLCGIELANDTVYLLSGSIWGRKLQVSLCGWNPKWDDVTARQRIGVRRFYGANCDCQISRCYGECEKLKGCGGGMGEVSSSDCEWGHSYCLKNAKGTACAWRETTEYKNCMSEAIP